MTNLIIGYPLVGKTPGVKRTRASAKQTFVYVSDVREPVAVPAFSLRKELKSRIADPAWLLIYRRGGRKAAAEHTQQPDRMSFCERQAAADAQGRPAQLRNSYDSSSVRLSVKLQVQFSISPELVTGDNAARP